MSYKVNSHLSQWIVLLLVLIISNVSCSDLREQKEAYDAYEKIISKCLDSAGEKETGSRSGNAYGKAKFSFSFKNKTIRVKYGYIPMDNYIENLLLENYEWYSENGTLSDMSIEEECGLDDSTKFYPVSIQGLWDSDKAGDGDLVIALSKDNHLKMYIFGESWKHWQVFELNSSEAEYIMSIFNEALEKKAQREHKPFTPIEMPPLSFFDDSQWEYEQQAAVAASHGYKHHCKDGKIGLIDGEAKEVIPTIYSKIELSDDGQYVKVWDGDKAGMKTIDGKEVLPVIYSDIMPLSFANLEKGDLMGNVFVPDDPYVVVYSGDKKGVANREGKIICDVKYDWIHWYDKLFCRNENGLDIIDLDSQETTHVDCENSCVSEESYIIINRNGKWGILDNKGNMLIDTIYDDIPSQGEGDAFCLIRGDGNNIAVIKDGKYGIIDLKGQVIVPFEYDEIDTIPYDGYRKLFKGTIDKTTWAHNGVWGLYKGGQIIVPCSESDKAIIDNYIGQEAEAEGDGE